MGPLCSLSGNKELMRHVPSTQGDYTQIGDQAKNKIEDILFMVSDCFKINLNGITHSKKKQYQRLLELTSRIDSTTFFVPLASPGNIVKVGQM